MDSVFLVMFVWSIFWNLYFFLLSFVQEFLFNLNEMVGRVLSGTVVNHPFKSMFKIFLSWDWTLCHWTANQIDIKKLQSVYPAIHISVIISISSSFMNVKNSCRFRMTSFFLHPTGRCDPALSSFSALRKRSQLKRWPRCSASTWFGRRVSLNGPRLSWLQHGQERHEICSWAV